MTFEGEHKVIPIKGIARAGADSVCEDGAMNEVVGFEYKDGSYVPYKEKDSITTEVPNNALGYYIHKTSTGNIALFIHPDGSLYWIPEDDITGASTSWTDMNLLCAGVVTDVEFIGNMVCISKDTGFLYMLYEPETATYEIYQAEDLESKLPKMSFRVSMYDDTNNMKGAYNEGNLLVVKGTRTSKGGDSNIYTAAGALVQVVRVVDLHGKGERSELANLANKAHYLLREKGRITGYVMALYAYKLKTGEYIYASSPVLLGMPKVNGEHKHELYVPSDEVYENAGSFTGQRFKTNINHYTTGFTLGDEDYTLTNSDILATDAWGVGKGLEHTYIETDTNVPPIFGWYHQSIYDNTFGIRESSFMVAAFGNILKCDIESDIPDELKPLIDSCCIFLSDIVSPYDFKESSVFSGAVLDAGASAYNTCGYGFTKRTDDEIKNDIRELKNFYKVHEIPFSKIKTGEFIVDLEGKLGDALFTQEVLPVSAFDHSLYKLANLETYNYRLHSFAYSQRLYGGYILPDYKFDNGQYGAYGSVTSCDIKVKIKSNDGYSEVWRHSAGTMPYVNAIIAYPDSNAYEMEVYTSTGYKKFDLEPSANGGYAYHLDSLVNTSISPDTTYTPPLVTTNVNDTFARENRIKVSSTYAANHFPLTNTYTIGNGRIIGLASLSIALSQDTFGQYPLLVFCTDGIYSMGVDTTGAGVYNNIAPFSREVCVNRNTICEIDGAVLFASSKGLMIATAQGVQEFLPMINGTPKHLPESTETTKGLGLLWYKDIISSPVSTDMMGSISTKDFIDFLSDKDTVVSYVSEKNKVIVYNGTMNYVYWIDIPTRNVTKLPVCIKFDNNNYPTEQYVKNDGFIITLPYLSDKGDVQCLLQTRPIKIVNTLKSSLRVVARGYLTSNDPSMFACMLVLGSLDAINWQPIGYKTRQFNGGFNDLGCVTDRVSCNYIMVIVTGSMNSDSHIDGIELTVNSKYNNKLK